MFHTNASFMVFVRLVEHILVLKSMAVDDVSKLNMLEVYLISDST